MLYNAINVILIFTVPLLIMRCQSSKLVSILGTVGTAYLVGIIFSVIASLVVPSRDTSVSEIIMYVCISLAIPLLLFSSNIKRVAQVSKRMLLSFLLLIVSVITATAAVFFIFARKLDCGEILSGMAVALYTGGTPNLNAVACFFRLDNTLLLMSNLSDIIFGGLFYVFLIFAAKPLLSRFLPGAAEPLLTTPKDLYDCATAFDTRDICESATAFDTRDICESATACDTRDICESATACDTACNAASRFSLRNPGVLRNIIISLAVTLVSLGIGLVIWTARGSADGEMVNYVVPSLMIGTTIGGIALSLSDRISSVRDNDVIGAYFATVFSYALASIIDLSKISGLHLRIFAFFAIITSAAFAIHALLCKMFRIGVDTMIVTATAGIYGPAFIPGVCRAIDANHILAPGLIVGSLGYAVGTFLGIACTYFLAMFV